MFYKNKITHLKNEIRLVILLLYKVVHYSITKKGSKFQKD